MSETRVQLADLLGIIRTAWTTLLVDQAVSMYVYLSSMPRATKPPPFSGTSTRSKSSTRRTARRLFPAANSLKTLRPSSLTPCSFTGQPLRFPWHHFKGTYFSSRRTHAPQQEAPSLGCRVCTRRRQPRRMRNSRRSSLSRQSHFKAPGVNEPRLKHCKIPSIHIHIAPQCDPSLSACIMTWCFGSANTWSSYQSH